MNKPKPIHAPMDQFETRDNELVIGGLKITELADKVGQTPFYAYDKAVIKSTIEKLRVVMPKELAIHYAIKANPMPELVQYISPLVDGFDLASKGEMLVALDTPMPVDCISIAGPGKSDDELEAAINAGITINMESFGEMERIKRIADKSGLTPNVAVRVNPDFELKASGMKMGGGPKQFGVDAELVPDMLHELKNTSLNFVGLHIFSGSQNLKEEAIIEAHDKTFELAERLLKDAPSPAKKLNIGGGLGIPYFPGETRIPLENIANNLEKHIDKFLKNSPRTKIIMELGRYLVGESGVYITKIIDKKVSRGHTFLVADGGLHHHLSASGNFGQVIRKNYPVSIANKAESVDIENASVVGPLCTPLDLLADKMDLPVADVGDLVCIYQSGAYGFTASPHAFLSHPDCAEILV